MALMLGIIGGSGLYDLLDLQDRRQERVETPFGQPSDDLIMGAIAGQPLAFLPRHGRGHRINPTNVPYRANIYALKVVGVTHLLSISAVGSLRENLAPLDLVIPDQIIDRTITRPRTFFERGIVAHVGIADPFCPQFRAALLASARATTDRTHDGGTYLCIEGPQFSTKAESRLFRSWGASIIGMTSMPEARLAREAELCYATLALVTDYDVWHETDGPVTVEKVIAALKANVQTARNVITDLVNHPLPERWCECDQALSTALSTDPSTYQPGDIEKLGVIGARYLRSAATT